MDASTIIIVNCLVVILSVAELMLTSSIYDFIVTHELFYAYPKKMLLIIPSRGLVQYIAAFSSFILSFAPIVYIAYQFQAVTSQCLIITHRAVQFACAVLHVISCTNSFHTAQKVALFIDDEEEYDFIAAAQWYALRLRISTAFFAFTSILILLLFFINVDNDLRRRFTHVDSRFNASNK